MEVITKKVERKFVKLGGKEVKLSKLLDFLIEIEGCTSSTSRLRYSASLSNVAEACIKDGFVETDVRGSWVLVDEERRRTLEENAKDAFYDD